MHRKTWMLLVGSITIVSLLALGWRLIGARLTTPAAAQADWAVARAVNGPALGNFKRVTEVRPLVFPNDHGPHREYQTEWWYYTGNLQGASGERWGYQLTFFRSGLTPDTPQRESQWATSEVYLAHFAVTDAAGRRFAADAQLARGGSIDLAGAQARPYRVFVKNWSAEGSGDTARLRAATEQVSIDLNLRSLKPATLQGNQGLSQKSAEVGNASYYYSLTRMQTTGTIAFGGKTASVEGLSWMDHEWGTSALGADQVGWDWLGMQVSDGSDLMWGQLRRTDGTAESIDGSLTDADSTVTPLQQGDVRWTPLATWRSPHTGVEYPARWRLQIPKVGLDAEVTPLIPDQELRVGLTYWEGAVRVQGTRGGQPIDGYGYVELTGYGAGAQQTR
ncbi:MAG TPA: lipocalin-like domain-containing protein [Herpetosiphonaceae bacterium]